MSPEQSDSKANPAPLAGVRVLDIATFLAAPFAGTVLADFGAEVIKVEQPKVGDPLRRFGTPTEAGDSLVWLSEARNKKSVTLGSAHAQGCGDLPRSGAPIRRRAGELSAGHARTMGAWASRPCARSILGW